jgi:hypothetical protein
VTAQPQATRGQHEAHRIEVRDCAGTYDVGAEDFHAGQRGDFRARAAGARGIVPGKIADLIESQARSGREVGTSSFPAPPHATPAHDSSPNTYSDHVSSPYTSAAPPYTSETADFIANAIKSFSFPVSGTKGWKEAQVMSGGVVLSEIDDNTMESKLIPGLYFAGEVLDYDGLCGGYNLNNAWITGIRAGTAARVSL